MKRTHPTHETLKRAIEEPVMSKRETAPDVRPAYYRCPANHVRVVTTGQPAPLTLRCEACSPKR